VAFPVTEAKVQDKFPPGEEVEGVEQLNAAGLVLTRLMNCILFGNKSVTTRFSTVCPSAIVAVMVYRRGYRSFAMLPILVLG